MKKSLRLGTRGSPLALLQAEMVRDRLMAANPGLQDENSIEIIPIRTSGDWRPEQKEQTFIEMGGDKGLFTKEIEEALGAGYIDMAVHSMKDVPTILSDKFEIAALLERADPHDVFVANNTQTLDELPSGAVIGTASLRRQAQILARRPDLRVVPLRGNVDTRLRKIADGEADATILALAGMERLGVEDRISSVMETDIMLPAVAQGAIGIEIRRGEEAVHRLLTTINCANTSICIKAERAFLQELDGSCYTPIAGLAQLQADGSLTMEGLVARPDGSQIIRLSRNGTAKDTAALGHALGQDIKSRMPSGFFDSKTA